MRHVILALMIATASPLAAQRVDDAQVAMVQPSSEASKARRFEAAKAVYVRAGTQASTRSMVIGGIIGGALGTFGGAMVGMALENCDGRTHRNCGVSGAILGGILGEAIGVPVGVNWVTNRRGRLSRSIPISIGLVAGCIMAGGAFGIAAIPPLQIYTSIRAERSST